MLIDYFNVSDVKLVFLFPRWSMENKHVILVLTERYIIKMLVEIPKCINKASENTCTMYTHQMTGTNSLSKYMYSIRYLLQLSFILL